MRSSGLLAIAATFSAASAVYQGFNYGSTQTDGSIKDLAAFTTEFKAAKALAGTNGAFSSARLYTNIVRL
jgi:glucan endo-1,3-beta-D-glucosidase